MKVVCSSCSAGYQVDLSKINGSKAWFKCKKCSENIVVEKHVDMDSDILDTFYPDENPDTLDLIGDTLEQKAHSDEETASVFDDNLDSAAVEDKQETQPGSAETLVPAKNYTIGLTAKVVLLMLIVSLLPGGLYFAISTKASHERILDETKTAGVIVSRHTALQVNEWIDKNIRALKAVAKLPDVQSMDAASQEKTLRIIQREYPWIYLAFTTDIKGYNIARSDGKPLKNYSDRKYVKGIAEGSELSWQTLIGKTSKKPALVLAVPIMKDGKSIGLVAAAMTRNAISERVTNIELGKTGSGFLIDQEGKTVAHQNNAFVLKQKNMNTHPLIQAAKSGRQTAIEFTDADGRTAIGFTAKTDLGWTLAIQQDKEEALAPLKKAQNSAIMLLGITLAIVFLIALLASRALVNPIKELTDAANRISVGEMDVEITNRPKNEIGDLAAAITRMQDSIRISISRLQRIKR